MPLAVAIPGAGAAPLYPGAGGRIPRPARFLLLRFVLEREMTSHTGLVLVNPAKWRGTEVVIILKKPHALITIPDTGSKGSVMRICPTCGDPVAVTLRYCPRCTAALPEPGYYAEPGIRPGTTGPVSAGARLSGGAWLSAGAPISAGLGIRGAGVSGGVRISGGAWVSAGARISAGAGVSGGTGVPGGADRSTGRRRDTARSRDTARPTRIPASGAGPIRRNQARSGGTSPGPAATRAARTWPPRYQPPRTRPPPTSPPPTSPPPTSPPLRAAPMSPPL